MTHAHGPPRSASRAPVAAPLGDRLGGLARPGLPRRPAGLPPLAARAPAARLERDPLAGGRLAALRRLHAADLLARRPPPPAPRRARPQPPRPSLGRDGALRRLVAVR